MKEKDHLGDLGTYGTKWIFDKYDGRVWNGLIWLTTAMTTYRNYTDTDLY
jgi:hypothetical protein